jgi:hypothetical protein
MNVENREIRSLNISAFLRCLHAAIEYSPKDKFEHEAIKMLSDIHLIKSLTQLCDTTGWFECNIGPKFLRILRHIVKHDLLPERIPFF